MAAAHGQERLHFVAQTDRVDKIDELKAWGFDAVNVIRLFRPVEVQSSASRALKRLPGSVIRVPWNVVNYKKAMKYWVGDEFRQAGYCPTLFPNWDDTPRSGLRGAVMHCSSPESFEQHCRDVLRTISGKDESYRVVILKSWNEWAEGNYVEPDLRFGMQYLQTLKSALLSEQL